MLSNNAKVMDAVREGRNNVPKKELQRLTGLSWGTMCKVTDTLLEKGYLFARREKPKAPGRPVVPLCVNPDSAYFCGIDIGAAFTKLVVCDMNFNVRYRSECVTEPFRGRERFLERVEEVFRTGMRESAVNPERVHALGLAVSGNVDSPVYAVTTQVGAVCAEYRFGKRAGCGNLVNIGLGVGIGSGIVANHLLLISHPKRPVGYIGHILIPNNNHICTCGFKGCLESYSGANYLAAIAAETLPGRPELHSAPALDRAAAKGDPDAAAILDTAASYNAIGIATMIQLYAPEALIFSGGQSREDGFLLRETVRRLHAHGIMVNASFVFGLPADRADVFDRTVEWAVSTGIESATFHLATPYPGTPFFRAMERERRLLHRDWERYDTRHAVIRHDHLTPEELEAGYWRSYREFYRWHNILRGASHQPSFGKALRHAGYSAAWKKVDPLWNLLIRLHRLAPASRLLEKVLDL